MRAIYTETSLYRPSKSVWQSIFVKHNFQEVIALVLGLFAEGFDSLYQGIKQM